MKIFHILLSGFAILSQALESPSSVDYNDLTNISYNKAPQHAKISLTLFYGVKVAQR